MAGLSHPQIVRLIHYGREGQWNYLVLEYVEGATLRRRLPCPEMALDLMKQLVDAVWYLHRQDLLHLDLKPENVMVTEAGEVKLLDFGLARGQVQTRLTAHGALVGTPAYLAPERFLEPNATATAAVDQYALGVIFFELLTGRLPYACEDPSLYVRAHQMPRPACEGELWLAEIAERMLSIEPQARFANLGEVLERLHSGPVANQETLL